MKSNSWSRHRWGTQWLHQWFATVFAVYITQKWLLNKRFSFKTDKEEWMTNQWLIRWKLPWGNLSVTQCWDTAELFRACCRAHHTESNVFCTAAVIQIKASCHFQGGEETLSLWRGVISRSMPAGLQLIWRWKPSRHTNGAEKGQQDGLRAKPEPLQNTEPFRHQPAHCPGSWAVQYGARTAFLPGEKKKHYCSLILIVRIDSRDLEDITAQLSLLPSSMVVLQQHVCTSAVG